MQAPPPARCVRPARHGDGLKSHTVMPMLTTTASPMNTPALPAGRGGQKAEGGTDIVRHAKVISKIGNMRTNSNSHEMPDKCKSCAETWSASTTKADRNSHETAVPRFSSMVSAN